MKTMTMRGTCERKTDGVSGFCPSGVPHYEARAQTEYGEIVTYAFTRDEAMRQLFERAAHYKEAAEDIEEDDRARLSEPQNELEVLQGWGGLGD